MNFSIAEKFLMDKTTQHKGTCQQNWRQKANSMRSTAGERNESCMKEVKVATSIQKVDAWTVTWRGLVAGAVGAAAIGLGCPYATMILKGSYMDIDFSAPAAIFVFFVLTAIINPILSKFNKNFSLRSGDLMTAYAMMLVATAIPTMGFGAQLIPIISSVYYYATPENRWAELIHPYLPTHLVPTDKEAIWFFYQGLPEGRSIPFWAWSKPLVWWIAFISAIYLLMLCLMVILRKQWVEHERLVYPLTQLPTEMVMATATGFYRKGMTWAGFLLPFVFGSLKGLNYYFPAFPDVREAFSVPWFRETQQLIFRLSFPMMGFFFLVNADILFSLWSLNFLAQIVRGILTIIGIQIPSGLGIYGSPYPIYHFLGTGAFFLLVISNLFVARHHLKAVLRKALWNDEQVDDSNEVLSYRWAVFLSLVAFLFACWWMTKSGLVWWASVLFLVVAFVIFLGLTRIVVEGGMAEAVAPTIAPTVMVSALGTETFGRKGLVALGLSYVWCSDIRTFVMVSAANALKMASSLKSGHRLFLFALALGVFLSLFSSVFMTLYLGYRVGAINTNTWFFIDGPTYPYRYVAEKILNPHSPRYDGMAIAAFGAGITALLTSVRRFLVWFPIHPIGFCISTIWLMDQLWFTCFLSWLLKVAILKYGGFQSYRRAIPFFLGLILGQFTCNGFWLILDYLTGHTGNTIFWI